MSDCIGCIFSGTMACDYCDDCENYETEAKK